MCEVGCARANPPNPASTHFGHFYRHFPRPVFLVCLRGSAGDKRSHIQDTLPTLTVDPWLWPLTWPRLHRRLLGGSGCRASGPLLGWQQPNCISLFSLKQNCWHSTGAVGCILCHLVLCDKEIIDYSKAFFFLKTLNSSYPRHWMKREGPTCTIALLSLKWSKRQLQEATVPF